MTLTKYPVGRTTSVPLTEPEHTYRSPVSTGRRNTSIVQRNFTGFLENICLKVFKKINEDTFVERVNGTFRF